MKICVFGVGRSGTTALYVLLQHIMPSTCREPIDFVYEPFLRDKDTFNGKYHDVIGKSEYVDSLSIEGISNHLSLPLFIDDPALYRDNLFLHKILHPEDKRKNILVKFIRANGRYPLINEICPECQAIFVIRNPVDVVNSILRRFSFYGGEFHRDDFPRFIKEINREFNFSYPVDNIECQLQKELLFWLYMNRFALESIKKIGKDVLMLCHEEYARNRPLHIKKICDFLNVDFAVEFLDVSNKSVGPITDKFEISEKEFEVFKEYLNEYFKLLDRYHIDFTFTEKEIFLKYNIVKTPLNRIRPFYGLHSQAITRKYQALLRQKDKQLREKDELIKKLEGRLADLESVKGIQTAGIRE